MTIRNAVCLIVVCLLLPACAKNYVRPLPEGEVALRKITDPTRIPDFRPAFDCDKAALTQAADQSLFYFAHPSSENYFPYLDVSHDRAIRSLEKFKEVVNSAVSADDLHRRIVDEFDVYESVGCDDRGTVFFTGYCTPIYEGSLKPTAECRYPLYKLPPDLMKGDKGITLGRKTRTGEIVPYYTRGELDGNRTLTGLELVYLKDRLDAYLVHVEGSARIRLPDGSLYDVGYAGSNGKEYKSLREMLMKDGKLKAERASLMGIKEYFKAHPEDLDVYLPRNERYVFFQDMRGGPYGSLGVPVTMNCSLATDKTGSREIYPRGCVAFIQTKIPTASSGKTETRKYSGFILDQDTGGAIRSAGRADIYMGIGPNAEMLAGHTAAEGRVYYIFVKQAMLDSSSALEEAPAKGPARAKPLPAVRTAPKM